MRRAWGLAVLLGCAGCVTIKERHLLMDPLIGVDDPVTDIRGDVPVETTYAALIEETGGEAGVFGGALIEFGGDVVIARESGDTELQAYRLTEGGVQGVDVRRVNLGSPGRQVSAVQGEGVLSRSDAPLIVYCSGTANTIDTTTLLSVNKVGPYAGAFFVFDYPGYGRSEGARSVAGIERAVAVVAEEVSRPDSRQLVLWGYSLGGFACAELAARVPADAVILDSPVRNAAEGIDFFVPRWLRPVARPFVRFDPALERFDIVESLAGLDTPILVIGAERDGILPEAGARSLFVALEAAGHDVAYVLAEKEGHYGMRDGDEVAEAVYRLLDVSHLDGLVPREE